MSQHENVAIASGEEALAYIIDEEDDEEALAYVPDEEDDEEELGLPILAHPNFYPGAETNRTMATLPCDNKFLGAILRDLYYLAYWLSHELPRDRGMIDEILPPKANEVAELLRQTMYECRRLKACPDLFPSRQSGEEFLSEVARISAHLATIGKMVDDDQVDERQTDQDGTGNILWLWDESEDEGIDCGPIYPAFSDSNPNGKHPWNNWLDNSAKAAFSWVAIQQKIPRFGDQINRKLTERYRLVEKQFIENHRVVRDPEKEPLEIDLPGESFRHMTWSGFATMPLYNLGFLTGRRKPLDSEGVLTLEQLQRVICMERELWVRRQRTPHSDNLNCPYFRFAVAYQPRYIPKSE